MCFFFSVSHLSFIFVYVNFWNKAQNLSLQGNKDIQSLAQWQLLIRVSSSEKFLLKFLFDSFNLSEQYILHVQNLPLPFKTLLVVEKMDPFNQCMQVGEEFKITLIVANTLKKKSNIASKEEMKFDMFLVY